jgi:hypothetical protein
MAKNEGSDAPAPSTPPQQLPTEKLKYKSPALVVYGSVRRLTHGSSGPKMGDGLGMIMVFE